ncbi:efflux RND transporter periplasmic adaptor subunit [Hoeflea sp. WL0058]|uniref:Efflux RND transporter periplasmic adaptor subunit n=1 Tax=Flavimaribacter sediminis TaxID=2865987 RepID=A0AAE3D2L7_9HYPH|nr:efflux RND transporter periplasmic adaptor subunit [Flavimaribacter sediminis]MBW8639924.1 efflux RND transporter periplasmic adaptor subunit [Flavimaribacter sediminis]
MRRPLTALTIAVVFATSASAADFVIEPTTVPVMKSVFGQVQSRDTLPARARIGGTVVEILIDEGDAVQFGDEIANVVDEKIALQLDAINSRQAAIEAQLENARTNVERARKLFERGTVAKTRLDEQQTAFDVLQNQLDAIEADKSVIVQQAKEGTVLAPASGRVLSVPVSQGSVVLAGETIARIAGGGYFLRLSLPERHAAGIKQGDEVTVGARGLTPSDDGEKLTTGHVAKVYPEISDGRVTADVEVDNLGDFFVGERTLVTIPIGSRETLLVPRPALMTRHGMDYVTVLKGDEETEVTVIPGESFTIDGEDFIEILTGLRAGDTVVAP